MPSKSWSQPPMNTRNRGGITTASLASSKGIGYLMKGARIDGRGSRPPELSPDEKQQRKLLPRPYSVGLWLFTDRAGSFWCPVSSSLTRANDVGFRKRRTMKQVSKATDFRMVMKVPSGNQRRLARRRLTPREARAGGSMVKVARVLWVVVFLRILECSVLPRFMQRRAVRLASSDSSQPRSKFRSRAFRKRPAAAAGVTRRPREAVSHGLIVIASVTSVAGGPRPVFRKGPTPRFEPKSRGLISSWLMRTREDNGIATQILAARRNECCIHHVLFTCITPEYDLNSP
ncbi:hypothetical protein EVAR_94590_1 [Eumeta japonica]|uniref:Uncharacterized protein n=1 Tax=Eumeta variegata TaxID=151549 RepID=A0A4C1UTG0_EUMVA|nr:hypothetical protein EVAR_94590_1 [Eumeta japonica]